MIVISDTGPIISLLKADCLYLLEDVFGEVIIPLAIYDELMHGDDFEKEKNFLNKASYLKVDLTDITQETKEIQEISFLDYGEAAALALAEKLKPDYMLIEDAKARKYAESKKFNVVGSLAVLIMSYKKGLVNKDDVYDATLKMKAAKRHISDKLYDKLYEIVDLDVEAIEYSKKEER